MSSSTLRITQVSAAKSELVTGDEARLHCRIDDAAENKMVASLIKAATLEAERLMRRPIMTKEYKQFFDCWPCERYVELWQAPLVSVTHVKAYDDADAATTFASSSYFVDTVSNPGRIVLRTSASWPTWTRSANPIEIQYRAGFGDDPAAVPSDIRQAVLMLIANMYENRGESVAAEAKDAALDLLWPYRVVLI